MGRRSLLRPCAYTLHAQRHIRVRVHPELERWLDSFEHAVKVVPHVRFGLRIN